MIIEKNKVVAISYDLTVEGKVVDTATEKEPLEYIHGMKMLIPKIEEAVEGKQEGDDFEVVVAPEDAYGEYDAKKKFDLPMESFEIDGKVREDILKVGNIIPMLNSSGHVVQGTIVEIKEDAVTMDFNPPMAGKTLEFKGKILSVRDATEKELREGLHGEFLPDECGCGCGHHHGGGHCHHDHEHGEGCCHGDHEHGEHCHHDHEHGEGCCHHHDKEDE